MAPPEPSTAPHLPGLTPAPRALGIVLPSSNRMVELVAADIVSFFPEIDACFTRVPYVGVWPGQPSEGYDEASFLAAADMLAEAGANAILWNGTRGALLGFEADRRLCERITARTGRPATTASLATLDLLSSRPRRVALVAQGGGEEAARIAARFAHEGIAIVASLPLGITDNAMAATVDVGRLLDFALGEARAADADAMLVWSTNLPGHAAAASLEAQADLEVLDSAAIGILGGLVALELDPRRAGARGRLFREFASAPSRLHGASLA